MSFHDYKKHTLEPLAEKYIGDHRVVMLTPLLTGSIVCGITWGVLGLQFVKWIARSSKATHWTVGLLATYLMIASTAYLGLLSTYMSYFFAYNFGTFAAAFDLTYSSWLFLIATVFIHVPCQLYYTYNIHKLSSGFRLLTLILVGLSLGVLGVGAALKGLLPDFAVSLTRTQSFLIKLWIALTGFTDMSLSLCTIFFLLRGKSPRFSEATFIKKVGYFIVDAQIPATLVSIGLLVLLMINAASPFVHLWLGLPLVYPITLFATLNGRRTLRDEIEVEAQTGDARRDSVKSEKLCIPPAEQRPSFHLSPFPAITIRRASAKFSEIFAPVTVPAMNGVRRASAFLGVIPPLSPKSRFTNKKRGFPFKKRNKNEPQSPIEFHPASLAYPLQADAAPMGMADEYRTKGLERAHSLKALDDQPSLSIAIGKSVLFSDNEDEEFHTPGSLGGRSPSLVDPFANVDHGYGSGSSGPSSRPMSRNPSPVKPASVAEALEVHEAFEMPATPDMLSPKSGNSPLVPYSEVPSPAAIELQPMHQEWK